MAENSYSLHVKVISKSLVSIFQNLHAMTQDTIFLRKTTALLQLYLDSFVDLNASATRVFRWLTHSMDIQKNVIFLPVSKRS